MIFDNFSYLGRPLHVKITYRKTHTSKRSDEHKIGKLRIKIIYVFIAQSYYIIHPMMVFLGSIWGI